MYTPGALGQREELRSHPAVQDGLRRLAKYAFQLDADGLVPSAAPHTPPAASRRLPPSALRPPPRSARRCF